jgi:hypothetical protein
MVVGNHKTPRLQRLRNAARRHDCRAASIEHLRKHEVCNNDTAQAPLKCHRNDF